MRLTLRTPLTPRPGTTFKSQPQTSKPSTAPQLSTDKLALEQQVSSLTVVSQRLERELAAAAAKAGQQEAQLSELYELCTSQQGEALQSMARPHGQGWVGAAVWALLDKARCAGACAGVHVCC